MDTHGINQMLHELNSVSKAASNKPSGAAQGAEGTGNGVDFAQVLQNALVDVSTASKDARQMAKDFEAGDPNVNIQEVMVDLQKASLSFQQMVQVRNRLVTAYQDIMNMPV